VQQYEAASKLIVNRSEQMKYCSVMIEHSLDLLGAVGIEDELQVVIYKLLLPSKY
jgi:magnesium-transporting ATPase (P-type)